MRGASAPLRRLLPLVRNGVFKRGEAPLLKNNFPLSCGTPRQERGIKGVRYKKPYSSTILTVLNVA